MAASCTELLQQLPTVQREMMLFTGTPMGWECGCYGYNSKQPLKAGEQAGGSLGAGELIRYPPRHGCRASLESPGDCFWSHETTSLEEGPLGTPELLMLPPPLACGSGKVPNSPGKEESDNDVLSELRKLEMECKHHTLNNIRGGQRDNLPRLHSRKHGGLITTTGSIITPSSSPVSEVFTMTRSSESTPGNISDTSSSQVSGSFTPVTVAFSRTPVSKAVTNTLRPCSPSPPSTSPPTLTISTASASTGSSSTAPRLPTQPLGGISLFPYGSSAGDLPLFVRGVDITSRLFKLQIGFPFGSSLRDSFYFTDNGQIIFPESDYHIFSYPNPPSRGFTRWDTVAMVAPFWDDADFSNHRGTIFYQEYETLYGEYNSLVRQVDTWIKQFTDSWDYNAKWTLKITWVKVPAYPAQWTIGTNTYQAILTTDGSRSYALFLYQRGGMQWHVTQRPHSSVVMGFSSGDGYFENSPLMSQPVWKKYRPDQFLDPKLGLQGLQVYRLHREERPNFRLKCLMWLHQPQRPSCGWSRISCPCSWQQGQWDLRFQPIRTGWWDSNSRKLCSFSSWRGGVCCSYGPWGEFREGWSLQSHWHFDQELEPQNWCCRWNDKPFLCDLYWQRQPRISCAGYRPPRPAWTFGDPHIVTFDDASYTFNGLGDFLLARASDENSSFLLQGRTAQTPAANATNFIAFAAQYNSSTVGPITVQWLLEFNNTIRVLHNYHNVTFDTNHVDAEGLQIFNTTGLLLTRNGSQISASFDGTVTITVIALSNILHASSNLPEEYQNRTEGLLGVWNNNPEDDFRMPNGSTIPRNSSEEMLYHYGMTWQINGTGLLGNRTGSLPSNFTPVFLSQLTMRNNNSLVAECNEDEQCTYDFLVTGNIDIGRHTRMTSEKYQRMNTSLNQNPPSISGPSVIEAYKGKPIKIQFSSNSENITFTLRDHCNDSKLFENGTFLWKPTSLGPCTLDILARDSRTGLSSALQPKAMVCFCKAKRQCLFNQTKWVGNSSLEVASCKCDEDSFGLYCERTKDPCDQQCFPNVHCIRGKGCEACPPNMTGDGRHCAALEDLFHCVNHSCPVNYCYNQGHCYISQTPDCQPTCTCPPAFTDTRCFLAGNNFTPAIYGVLPLRVIHLTLKEGENASVADVNASVAYRLETLEVQTFLRNSQVQPISQSILTPGHTIQHWLVTSKFQYRPRGPVIHFLNNQLREAIVEAFLQAPRGRQKRNGEPKNNVYFYPISKGDIREGMAVNLSTLETYFKCDGYKGYRLAYDPQSGFTCVSPCSENYCHHGGQCQHLPDGPRCSCLSFAIYTSWGERCERLSVKLGAFLGILFGALGALLLLGIAVLVGLRVCGRFRAKNSYPLFPES
ncbi:mucin-4 [Dipodomys spectabilis]|uniref:mucin-4 n=1 Tax=Dipodomys spectabilis TaxID=105255 RepID=UPI001C5419ED|nr:mucin-4 [Dipodomys spectabilis]